MNRNPDQPNRSSSPRQNAPAGNPFAQVPISQMSWMVRIPEGGEYGPVDRAELLRWVAEGRLDARCRVRSSESSAWQPALTVVQALQQPDSGPSHTAESTGNRRLVRFAKSLPDSNTRRTFVIALLGIITCFPLLSVWAWKRSGTRLLSPEPLRRVDEQLLRFVHGVGLVHAGFTCLAIAVTLFVLLVRFLGNA